MNVNYISKNKFSDYIIYYTINKKNVQNKSYKVNKCILCQKSGGGTFGGVSLLFFCTF